MQPNIKQTHLQCAVTGVVVAARTHGNSSTCDLRSVHVLHKASLGIGPQAVCDAL